MKKLISILFLLIFCVLSYSQWFSLGLKVGYNTTLSSNQTYKETFDVKSNMQNGAHAGIYMRLGRRVFAQPEILYNYSTYNRYINNGGTQLNGKTYKTHSVDVPILLGVSAVNSDIFKLRLMVGPKFSFDVGSTDVTNLGSYEEKIRKTRLGLDCGIGFDIWRVTIDLRYNLFSNLYKIQDPANDNKTINNSSLHTIQVTAGFRLFGQNSNR